jgi:hypothetical protein
MRFGLRQKLVLGGLAIVVVRTGGTILLSPLVFHRGEGHGKHAGEVTAVGGLRQGLGHGLRGGRAGRWPKVPGGRIFHDFRRSCHRNLRRAGKAENVCMKITGHRTPNIFHRYSIVDEQDIAEALTRMQAHLQAEPAGRTVIPMAKAAEDRQQGSAERLGGEFQHSFCTEKPRG